MEGKWGQVRNRDIGGKGDEKREKFRRSGESGKGKGGGGNGVKEIKKKTA